MVHCLLILLLIGTLTGCQHNTHNPLNLDTTTTIEDNEPFLSFQESNDYSFNWWSAMKVFHFVFKLFFKFNFAGA